MKLFIICLVLLAAIPNICYGGGRILFLTPMGTRSHKIFFMGIAEALAEKGHHITMVSGYEDSRKIENIRDVVVHNFTFDTVLSNVFENPDVITTVFEQYPENCVAGLRQPHIQDLKNEKFDLIIVSLYFEFCYLSFVHHFKVPFIYASPCGLLGYFNEMVGNPDFPSITGNKLHMMELDFPLDFKHRLIITVSNTLFLYAGSQAEPEMLRVCKEKGICPPEMPNINEFHKNASLTIINSVRTLEYPPRPTTPNIIYAGGAHIKPSKPLPQDLEEWIQGSGEEGFIFFSLGSALNPALLPENYRKILVNVLGSLKQRVLWKWSEETMPDLPRNVKLSKWLPQPDVLGHPKLRLFITHGGLLSTQEATYNGVPVIGMPVFADQYANMDEVETEGWGKTMKWELFEEEVFRNMIKEVLNNKKYREISLRRSKVMKDRLVHPADEAAYWVEYVMRHNGAAHITSPVLFMKWYELYNVDVWSFIIGTLIGIVTLIGLFFRFLFRKCFGASKSQNSKRKRD